MSVTAVLLRALGPMHSTRTHAHTGTQQYKDVQAPPQHRQLLQGFSGSQHTPWTHKRTQTQTQYTLRLHCSHLNPACLQRSPPRRKPFPCSLWELTDTRIPVFTQIDPHTGTQALARAHSPLLRLKSQRISNAENLARAMAPTEADSQAPFPPRPKLPALSCSSRQRRTRAAQSVFV